MKNCPCDGNCDLDGIYEYGKTQMRTLCERFSKFGSEAHRNTLTRALGEDIPPIQALNEAIPGIQIQMTPTSSIDNFEGNYSPPQKIQRLESSINEMASDDDMDGSQTSSPPLYRPDVSSNASQDEQMPYYDNETPINSRANGNGMPKIVDDFSKCPKCNDFTRLGVRCLSCLGSYHWNFECAGDMFNADDSEFLCSSCMEYCVNLNIEFETITNFNNFNINAAKRLVRQHLGSSEELQNALSSLSPYYRYVRETMDINEDYVVIADYENAEIEEIQEAEIEEIEVDELPRPPHEPAAPLNDEDFAGMIDRGDMTDDQYARAIALLRYKDNLPQDEEVTIGESIFEICCVKENILCVRM